jgi:hypothetical protein
MATACYFLDIPWAFCMRSVSSSASDSLLGSLLSKLGIRAPLIPLTPAHDLNLMS